MRLPVSSKTGNKVTNKVVQRPKEVLKNSDLAKVLKPTVKELTKTFSSGFEMSNAAQELKGVVLKPAVHVRVNSGGTHDLK